MRGVPLTLFFLFFFKQQFFKQQNKSFYIVKIRIPRRIKLKFNIDKVKNVFSIIGFIFFSVLALSGIVYGINRIKYTNLFEQREAQCVQFTEFINEEVLPLTTANVTDCDCHFANVDVGTDFTSNCLCSCILYDENGTLIDADWNPLFSTLE